MPAGGEQRRGEGQELRQRGQGAGGDERAPGQAGGLDSDRMDADAGAPVMRAASRRKAALRWSASIRSNGTPVARARIRPGKPAPEPRSMARAGSGSHQRDKLERIGDMAVPKERLVAPATSD